MTMSAEEEMGTHDEKDCRHAQGHEICGKCAAEYVLEIAETWKIYRRLGKSEKTLFVRDLFMRLFDVLREVELLREARSAKRTVDEMLQGIGTPDGGMWTETEKKGAGES
jgi:hypothetical protein